MHVCGISRKGGIPFFVCVQGRCITKFDKTVKKVGNCGRKGRVVV